MVTPPSTHTTFHTTPCRHYPTIY